MVYRRKLISRTQFRKLPFGAIYWSTAMNAAPLVKTGRKTAAGIFATNRMLMSTILDSSTAVVKVPPVFLSPP